MKKHFSRFLSAVLALTFVVAMFACYPITASAASYKTGANAASASYKSGKYYAHHQAITLTGDGPTDVLAMAISQLGYQEGASAGAYSGLVGGSNNYTEYCYNMGDFGSGYGGSSYPWCATFVSWCLLQGRATSHNTMNHWCRHHFGNASYIWREISCHQWYTQLANYTSYWRWSAYRGGSYIPTSGDLIFFANSSTTGHIGFVLYCDGATVYTIEGNTSNNTGLDSNGGGVYYKSYTLGSSYIYGYGHMPYSTVSSAKIDYSGKNPTTGQYMTTGVNKYIYPSAADAAAGTNATSTILPAFTMFNVTAVPSTSVLQINYNGTIGYIQNKIDGQKRVIQLSKIEFEVVETTPPETEAPETEAPATEPETETQGCDHFFSSIDDWEPIVEIVTPATCTKAGLMYYLCEKCGERDTAHPEILPATGHNYQTDTVNPTCTEDGYTTYLCSDCGDSYIVDVFANGHVPGDTVEENRVEPTATANGSYDQVVYCSACSEELSRKTVTLPATGEIATATATIKGASVTLGQALGITYNAVVENATAVPVMKFTVGEGDSAMTAEVVGVYHAANDRYYFELTGVTPQRLADNVLAEVYVDGVLIASKDNYSIKTNLVGQLSKDTTSDALKTLIYNTLAYGAAAQVVTSHNTNNIINAGYEDKAVSYPMGATDGSDQGFAINNTLTDVKISGVSVNFGDVNKIMVQYVGHDVTLYANGVPVTAELINGKYTYYTDGIFASELGMVYTFTLKTIDGETVSTLTYSVNAYCARQQGKTTDNAKLAIALFNYGMAAKSYVG